MPGVTQESNVITSPVWAADFLSRDHLVPGPIELDPTQFPMDDGTFVTANGAAAIGATSITVDAIDAAIPANTFLDFGHLASVLVTIADASVSAGDTSVTVVALPGPIPSGTRLNFSGGTNAQVVEVNGDHAAGATTLTVLPLDGTIANGATATFPGGTKQARLTAAAAAGATTLTVDELQFAIADNDVATYGGSGTLKRRVKGGTFVGRTYTERESSTPFGPAASGDDEVFLLAFDAPDIDADPTATAVRPGTAIKENFLPFYGTMSSAVKALLRAAYVTQKGVA